MESSARSQIDQACAPAKKDYFMTIHQKTIHLQSETLITQPTTQPSQDPDPPFIENFYCYSLHNHLVKVTKIRIGNELVTMLDRISFPELPPKDENQQQNSRSFPQEASSSAERLKLSVGARNVLTMLENWLKDNEPDLYLILQEMKETTKNEGELIRKMSSNYNFREGFSQFCEYILPLQTKKSVLRTIDQWKKTIISASHLYHKKENFINDILSGKELLP